MTRLMFVTGSLAFGGAERHSITLMNRLGERGYDCHAVYVKSAASQRDRMRLRDGATVKCLDAARYFDRRAIADFAIHIARVKPSVIIAANPYALMYARLALSRSAERIPLLVTFHSTLMPNIKEWLQMLYYRPFFWTADCLVYVCETQRRHWARRLLGARRVRMIHNGVDVAHWRPHSADERATMRESLGFGEDDLVIAMCAVFRPEKNHLQLIEAIAALRRRGIAARALLIGDGELRATIEAHALQLGVSDALAITGFQQDVRPYIGAADVVVLCSTTVETFSLAALESMALARPIVLSQTGGAAEMVVPGYNGYLFPIGDTGALVDRLASLADAGVRTAMGRHSRQLVEARFSESAMIERYENTLLELCGRPLRRAAAVTN